MRPTRRERIKIGLSNPNGVGKGCYSRETLEITGRSFPKVWRLDVGSSPPGAVVCYKG